MEDCIFCKIVSGEIPADREIHDEGTIISLLDIHPVRPGHTLIIPKTHYRWFWDMPEDLTSRVFNVARTLAPQLKEKYGADYIQLSIVGKDVPHVHVHLIPRMFHDTDVLP